MKVKSNAGQNEFVFAAVFNAEYLRLQAWLAMFTPLSHGGAK
jgi:hypothetical protein